MLPSASVVLAAERARPWLPEVATSWWVQNVEKLRPSRASVAGSSQFMTESFETGLDTGG